MQVADTNIDIRNNYNIEFLKINKNIVFSMIKDKNIVDDNPNKIDFSFLEVSEIEIDFNYFSSLEGNKLYFDEMSVVPLEFADINLPVKEKPYHSRLINNNLEYVDSGYIGQYEKLGINIDFKISTKNGINFYFNAKKFEITIE
jgi:hypothetical protein